MRILFLQSSINLLNKTNKISAFHVPSQNNISHNGCISFGADRLTMDYYDKIGSKQREDIAFQQTINQRNRFLDNVLMFSDKKKPEDIYILDAGCGTGRDTKFFVEEGYNTSAFDASFEMTKRAQNYTGIDVACEEFLTFSSDTKFDGIYARNSLLHVPKNEFKKSVANMTKLLKPDGILWATLKSGKGESRDKKGRLFSYYSVSELQKVLSDIKGVSIVQIEQYNNEAVLNDNPIIEFIIKKN